MIEDHQNYTEYFRLSVGKIAACSVPHSGCADFSVANLTLMEKTMKEAKKKEQVKRQFQNSKLKEKDIKKLELAQESG